MENSIRGSSSSSNLACFCDDLLELERRISQFRFFVAKLKQQQAPMSMYHYRWLCFFSLKRSVHQSQRLETMLANTPTPRLSTWFCCKTASGSTCSTSWRRRHFMSHQQQPPPPPPVHLSSVCPARTLKCRIFAAFWWPHHAANTQHCTTLYSPKHVRPKHGTKSRPPSNGDDNSIQFNSMRCDAKSGSRQQQTNYRPLTLRS